MSFLQRQVKNRKWISRKQNLRYPIHRTISWNFYENLSLSISNWWISIGNIDVGLEKGIKYKKDWSNFYQIL